MIKTFCLLAVLAVAATANAGAPPATHLLFSHVTNSEGFDTLIVIANTSFDLLGTKPEDGECTISFFGTNAPAPLMTGTIVAGSVFATDTFTVAPNFFGYAFADCSFNHAHGLTFVGDIGFRNVSYGGEASVVPKKKRPRAGERLAR